MAGNTLALAERRAPVLVHRHAKLSPPPSRFALSMRAPFQKTDAIIFDMDGVLVDSRRAAANALAAVAKMEGVNAGSDEIANALEKGNSAASIVSCLMPCLSGNADELARVARAYTQASLDSGEMEKTAIAMLLPGLAGKYRLAIATNRTRDAALAILDLLGIRGFFEAVMTLEDAPPKPDPKMVLLAAVALGSSVQNSVFVGDKPSDRLAGEGAGVRTIMVDACMGTQGCWPFIAEFGPIADGKPAALRMPPLP